MRQNMINNYFLPTITICLLSTYLPTYLSTNKVVERLELNTLRSLKTHGGVDRALLSFDLHVDLTPAFHWNIKQLFVYVVASYATETNPTNKVVLWDKIVEAIDPPEAKILKEDNVFVEYALVDYTDELRGKEVELQLMWDFMPITGARFMDGQDESTTSKFRLPDTYR